MESEPGVSQWNEFHKEIVGPWDKPGDIGLTDVVQQPALNQPESEIAEIFIIVQYNSKERIKLSRDSSPQH